MLIEDVRQQISKFFPQLNLISLVVLGKGTDSIAYLINKKWVFRFPKNSESQKALKTEIALLPHLEKTLSVQIPNFAYVARDNNTAICAGYPLLPGVAFNKSNFEALHVVKQEQFFKELANFMQSVHNFPVKIAYECGIKKEIYKGAYHPEQKNLYKQFSHLLSSAEIQKIDSIFVNYEKNMAKDTLFTLLHADLKPDHILYDLENEKIASVIDWGDICIGDPDYDFTCLYLYYGENSVSRLLEYFPRINKEYSFYKIQFFTIVRWIQDCALGIKHQDDSFVSFCIKKLRKNLLKI